MVNEFNESQSYIQILELQSLDSFDFQLVKQQYKKLILRYHPDIAEEKYKSGEHCKLLNAAYEFFTDYFKTQSVFINKTTTVSSNWQTNFSAHTYSSRKPTKEPRKAFHIFVDAFDLKNRIWKKCDSSNIDSYTYDDVFNMLFVVFKNHNQQNFTRLVYCYFNLPPTIYREFEDAKSKGRYLIYNLIGQYKCGKLDISHYPKNWQKFNDSLRLYY